MGQSGYIFAFSKIPAPKLNIIAKQAKPLSPKKESIIKHSKKILQISFLSLSSVSIPPACHCAHPQERSHPDPVGPLTSSAAPPPFTLSASNLWFPGLPSGKLPVGLTMQTKAKSPSGGRVGRRWRGRGFGCFGPVTSVKGACPPCLRPRARGRSVSQQRSGDLPLSAKQRRKWPGLGSLPISSVTQETKPPPLNTHSSSLKWRPLLAGPSWDGPTRPPISYHGSTAFTPPGSALDSPPVITNLSPPSHRQETG